MISVYGEGGIDRSLAATVNDILDGRRQFDILVGGDGNDTLIAGDGNDTAYGEGRGEIIYAAMVGTPIFGGEGNDTVDWWGRD